MADVTREYAIQLKQRAQKSLESDDPHSTIADCSMSLRVYGEDSEIRVIRATAYQAIGNVWAAVHDFSTAIMLNPNAHVYFERACIYYTEGEYDKTVLDATRGLELAETDSKIAGELFAIRSCAYFRKYVVSKNNKHWHQCCADSKKALRIFSL